MSKRADIPEKIGPFTRLHNKPSSMKYGIHYEGRFETPFTKRRRKVHVWIPGDYDFKGRHLYPVIYMADGQNLVDRYLTKFGDWHLDRVVRELKKQGYREPILVGVDSPKNGKKRFLELNPPYRPDAVDYPEERPLPYADVFVDFIADELRPIIEELFFIDKRKEATAIGGSSMGGIVSIYGLMRRPDVFGCALSFSVPFFFYKEKTLDALFKEWNPSPEKNGKIFFFVGNKDFEARFTPGVRYVSALLKNEYGFDDASFLFIEDLEAIHHEEWWYRYSLDAMKFWLSDSKKD